MKTTYTIEFMRLAEPTLRRSSIHRPFMSPIIGNLRLPLMNPSANLQQATFTLLRDSLQALAT